MKIIGCMTAVIMMAAVGTGISAEGGEAQVSDGRLVAENQVVTKKTGKFVVYAEQGSQVNHYIPSGWMGDTSDIKMIDSWKEKPKDGKTCLKFSYSAKGSKNAGWAGIYWQNPANNWGEKKKGFNLTGAKRLTFWARGEKGGEVISEFKMGGISGEYPDTDSQGIGPVTLTKEWKQYTIDLAEKDISQIIGGFCWVTSRDDNPEGATFYLDEIQYEYK